MKIPAFNYFIKLHLLWIAFGLLMVHHANAQFFIMSVDVLPSNPNNIEETKLIVKMYYDISGCDYNSKELSCQLNYCTVNEYFDCNVVVGNPDIKIDTVNMGILLADTFYCTIVMNTIDHSFPQPDTILQDSMIVVFIVDQNNQIVQLPNKRIILNCFPNPSDGIITIENEYNYQNFELDIYDVTGVLKKSIAVPVNTRSLDINLSAFSNGIYWLSCRPDKRNFASQKIVIIK